MIDPTSVISYDRNPWELEEFLMFCILVAGKNAKTTARLQEELLNYCIKRQGRVMSPFDLIQKSFQQYPGIFSNPTLVSKMKEIGFGCYSLKAKSLWAMASKIRDGLDISKCSVEDLESVIGVGPKTARFFLVFSRPNQNDIAILDVHALAHLRELGYDVPKATPTGKKYKKIEQIFVDHVKKSGKTMAEYDLATWVSRSQK